MTTLVKGPDEVADGGGCKACLPDTGQREGHPRMCPGLSLTTFGNTRGRRHVSS